MLQLYVLGDPVAHSLSPVIHQAWAECAGKPFRYDRLLTTAEALPEICARIRSGEIYGANVTLPHKQAAFALCDRLAPAAVATGAVNTLWRDAESGELWGDNTDAEGFLTALRAKAPKCAIEGGRVCVLGAGGAARAVIHALLQAGALEAMACARHPLRAEGLRETFGPRVSVRPWDEAARHAADSVLTVNTVPPGEDGGAAAAAAAAGLGEGRTACDIVYYPLMTPFLREAAGRGAVTVTGEGMLLHQAAAAFRRWFGVLPDVELGGRALLEALSRRGT